MSKFVSRSAIAICIGIGLVVFGSVLPLASQEQEKPVEKPIEETPKVAAAAEDESAAKQNPKVQPNQPHEDLDAVLWVQTSAEYDAVSYTHLTLPTIYSV